MELELHVHMHICMMMSPTGYTCNRNSNIMGAPTFDFFHLVYVVQGNVP